MKIAARFFPLILLLVGFGTTAHAASANFFGPLVSYNCTCPQSGPDYGCVLQTFQNTINLGISLSIIVFVLIAAFAGFRFMTTGGSSEAREQARTMALNIVVGLALVLSAWLIVDFIMKELYNPNTSVADKNFGPWNAILSDVNADHMCIAKRDTTKITNGVVAAFSPGMTSVGSSGTLDTTSNPNGTVPENNIIKAANSYIGQSTAAGPSGGKLACAWAVNTILTKAGINAIGGNSVQEMENALKGGRGTAITQSAAKPGDIVIEAGDGHVGICKDLGCKTVISNSSSNASFTWTSGPDFAPSYGNGIGRFYRVNG